MAIVRAYVMPHPPLAVPEVGQGKERGIVKTIKAMDTVAKEIAGLKPDTIIFITPHGIVYSDYFHISPGESAVGDFSRFGVAGTRVVASYDKVLTAEISRLSRIGGIHAGTQGERDAALDHGVTVPMYYINRQFREYKALRISQSGLDAANHYRMGQVLAAATENLRRKVVIIASGDLSHKLEDTGPYGYAPEGAKFDQDVMKHLGEGDFLSLLSMDSNLRVNAAECGFNSFVMMSGCFDGISMTARTLSYEAPYGVGYGVVSFIPGQPYPGRNILVRYESRQVQEVEALRATEDPYRALARQSLEYSIKTNDVLKVSQGMIVGAESLALTEEMLSHKAGAFVSIHKNGLLRGCIGTIAPTQDCIASEIIKNAVSAGVNDNRFPPVDESELPFLTYKVDILDTPEDIYGEEDLDVKHYGVIVESGIKRGLLLPNLEGINTPAQQIEIACKKAGITPSAPIKLQRFKVTRYE